MNHKRGWYLGRVWAVLYRVVRECYNGEMMFDQRPGKKSNGPIWGRVFQKRDSKHGGVCLKSNKEASILEKSE